MSVEVVEKRKGSVICGDCGEELDSTVTKSDGCPHCDSHNIKKSLVVVRKAVGDEEDDLENEVDDELEEEEDVDEEEDELDDEDLDDEDDEEEDDDLDEEDEDEELEEEAEDAVPVGKRSAELLGLEALNISTALAEDVAKLFTSRKVSKKAYEDVMVEFNNVMDAAADRWFKGGTVSKAKDKQGHAALIRERVSNIVKTKKEAKKMPKRPKTLDSLDLPDDVKKYIGELESDGEVKKSVNPYAGLPEEVQKSLKAADKIVEEREQEKWEGVAKNYKHFPGNKTELAKTLRSLSESAPEAFEELKKSLDAAEYNLAQSDIFKSYGRPGGDEEASDEITKRKTDAQKLVDDGKYQTIEQAEVALMDGSAYKPTAK